MGFLLLNKSRHGALLKKLQALEDNHIQCGVLRGYNCGDADMYWMACELAGEDCPFAPAQEASLVVARACLLEHYCRGAEAWSSPLNSSRLLLVHANGRGYSRAVHKLTHLSHSRQHEPARNVRPLLASELQQLSFWVTTCMEAARSVGFDEERCKYKPE